MTTLFDPIRFGNIAAANRIVMAPMARNRTGPGQVPTPLMATYYEQRATTGLIVSEATQIAPDDKEHLDTPGIYSAEQKAGWRPRNRRGARQRRQNRTAVVACGAYMARFVATVWAAARV